MLNWLKKYSLRKERDMKLENLVCLTKGSNPSNVRVIELANFFYKEHVEVDLEKGTWEISSSSTWITPGDKRRGPFRIGSSVRSSDVWSYPYHILGIYDRTNTRHLESMASEASNYGHGPTGWDDE
jgi:hypothetical protein